MRNVTVPVTARAQLRTSWALAYGKGWVNRTWPEEVVRALVEMQKDLDFYLVSYNTKRPHQRQRHDTPLRLSIEGKWWRMSSPCTR